MSFLAMDDPKHMRIRKHVSKGFTPARVNHLADRVTGITHRHWDRCLQMGEFDYVAEFAGLLPMDVVSELLLVPVADRARLRELSDALIRRDEGVFDVPEAAVAAYFELVTYYADLVADRRTHLVDDLVSALIRAEIVDEETGEPTSGSPICSTTWRRAPTRSPTSTTTPTSRASASGTSPVPNSSSSSRA